MRSCVVLWPFNGIIIWFINRKSQRTWIAISTSWIVWARLRGYFYAVYLYFHFPCVSFPLSFSCSRVVFAVLSIYIWWLWVIHYCPKSVIPSVCPYYFINIRGLMLVRSNIPCATIILPSHYCSTYRNRSLLLLATITAMHCRVVTHSGKACSLHCLRSRVCVSLETGSFISLRWLIIDSNPNSRAIYVIYCCSNRNILPTHRIIVYWFQQAKQQRRQPDMVVHIQYPLPRPPPSTAAPLPFDVATMRHHRRWSGKAPPDRYVCEHKCHFLLLFPSSNTNISMVSVSFYLYLHTLTRRDTFDPACIGNILYYMDYNGPPSSNGQFEGQPASAGATPGDEK